MKSLHINTTIAFYIIHFATFSMGKKQVIQLIPNAMGKNVYVEYQKEYLDSRFVDETLKGHLHNTLKELKT
jgi:hypothetical protein